MEQNELTALVELIEKTRGIFVSLGITTLLPVLIVFFKIGLDSFNMTGIERVMLTNSKKLAIQISQISLASFISSVLFWIGVQLKLDLSLTSFFILYIISFVLLFVCIFILYNVIYWYINLFIPKIDYYLEINKQDIGWKIVKTVDKNRLLLSKENTMYKFIEIDKVPNKTITLKANDASKWFYHSNVPIEVIKGMVHAMTLGAFIYQGAKPGPITDVEYNCRLILLGMLFFSYLIGLHSVVVYKNKKLIDKNEEQNKNKNQPGWLKRKN